jgi:hypothetical protein
LRGGLAGPFGGDLAKLYRWHFHMNVDPVQQWIRPCDDNSDGRVLTFGCWEFATPDHVVVGPTGVFVLDSKSWRDAVSAAGSGASATE